MAITIQRPSGVNVGVNNPGTTVYIQGRENLDGSVRLITDEDGNILAEIRVSGVWSPTDMQFSYSSHVIDDTLAELVFDQNGEAVFQG